jgi:hypothetical protein
MMGPCAWCRRFRRLVDVRAPPDFAPAAICEDCACDERADGAPVIHHEHPQRIHP